MAKSVILAAIGHLPRDNYVLSRALELSRMKDATLHVVHVLNLPGKAADLDDSSTILGQAAFAARDRITATLREMGSETTSVNIQIKVGAHALCLIDLCEDLVPTLIVMRAHQRKKLSETLLGSTTDRVIAAAATPVLVVKTQAQTPYMRAVLATNGTDDAHDILQFMSWLLPEARLYLVQVVQISRQLKEAMLRTSAGKTAFTDYREQLTIAAENHLRALMTKSGRTAVPVVFKGDPAKTLSDFCATQDIDLIALGQGNSNLVKRAFIGSVSRRLLRDASCDVLIY